MPFKSKSGSKSYAGANNEDFGPPPLVSAAFFLKPEFFSSPETFRLVAKARVCKKCQRIFHTLFGKWEILVLNYQMEYLFNMVSYFYTLVID